MKHTKLAIFEGTMCCESGVCGVEPNKTLVEFNDTLKKLKKDYPELVIQRANMSYNLEVFVKNPEILKLVREKGIDILPIMSIDGNIFSKQTYPKYDELKQALEA
jgi:hypothetical protein